MATPMITPPLPMGPRPKIPDMFAKKDVSGAKLLLVEPVSAATAKLPDTSIALCRDKDVIANKGVSATTKVNPSLKLKRKQAAAPSPVEMLLPSDYVAPIINTIAPDVTTVATSIRVPDIFKKRILSETKTTDELPGKPYTVAISASPAEVGLPIRTAATRTSPRHAARVIALPVMAVEPLTLNDVVDYAAELLLLDAAGLNADASHELEVTIMPTMEMLGTNQAPVAPCDGATDTGMQPGNAEGAPVRKTDRYACCLFMLFIPLVYCKWST